MTQFVENLMSRASKLSKTIALAEGTDVRAAKAAEILTQKNVCKVVLIGNEEDFTACLGLEVEGNDVNLKELNIDGYKKMMANAAELYPNFKVAASTLRTVKTATVNDWSAICWADGRIYNGLDFKDLEIYDRVGGGDSFAS